MESDYCKSYEDFCCLTVVCLSLEGFGIIMTEEAVLNIASEAIWTIIISAGPLLIVSLILGLIVSIFQTVTSIQEQTLTFIPKLLGIFIVMLILGSFIINNIVTFMTNLWSSFGDYIL